MSKEPAEILTAASDIGFIDQLKLHSTVSQFGQLNGTFKLDGSGIRDHFREILHNQVLNGKFQREFSKIEGDLEKNGAENPLEQLYAKAKETELAQGEAKVRARLRL